MISRVVRAFRLDPRIFSPAAQAEGSMDEAVLIALLVAALAGAGIAISARLPLLAFLLEMLNSLVLGWLVPGYLVRAVARRMGNRVALDGISRVLAYASVPRLLLFFGFIPFFGWFFRIPGWTLGLILSVIGVREFTGWEDPGRLLLAVIPGASLYIITSAILCLVFGGMPMVGL